LSDGDIAEHPQELLDQSPRESLERVRIGSSTPTPGPMAVLEDHLVLQDSTCLDCSDLQMTFAKSSSIDFASLVVK
jgi:hypothetical protein